MSEKIIATLFQTPRLYKRLSRDFSVAALSQKVEIKSLVSLVKRKTLTKFYICIHHINNQCNVQQGNNGFKGHEYYVFRKKNSSGKIIKNR